MVAATGPAGPRARRRAWQPIRQILLLVVGALLLASCAPAGLLPDAAGGRSTTGSAASTAPGLATTAVTPSASASVTSSPTPTPSPDPTPSGPQAWTPSAGASPFAFYDAPTVPAGSVHGTLLRYQQVGPVPGAQAGATLWRILYLTRSATGTSVLGSGYVAVPAQGAPAGGYPVISWAHGSTGMARACAPSLFSTTLPGGLRHLILAPYLATLVDRGYLVTAADYPGLGTQGTLGYYSGPAEGYAVLDAIRAAQGMPDWHASHTAVILGHSQGGHSALFAGQLAAGYTPEQRIVGVVAAAPVTWLTGIASAATTSSAPVNSDLLLLVVSWSRTYPGLPLDKLLTPSAITGIGRLTSMCDDAVTKAYLHTPSSAIFLPAASTNRVLDALGRANTPGATPTKAPILIVQGSSDNEVNVADTTSFVHHLCTVQPDRLTYTVYHGATHDGVLKEAQSQILTWIADRIAGKPAPTGCG